MAVMRRQCNADKKDLRRLAGDFGLLHREDVQEVIKNCKSYTEGQQKIMRIYTNVYMDRYRR